MKVNLPSPLRGTFPQITEQIARAKEIDSARTVPVILNAQAEADWLIQELAKNPEQVFRMREIMREFEYSDHSLFTDNNLF